MQYAATGAGDQFPKNGTWRWTPIPLSFLVMHAYDISLKQIADIPKPFQGPEIALDIAAKMSAGVTDAEFRMMLQSLLADRFKFAMHREARELPVGTIEVAKGGPDLLPASACRPGSQPRWCPSSRAVERSRCAFRCRMESPASSIPAGLFRRAIWPKRYRRTSRLSTIPESQAAGTWMSPSRCPCSLPAPTRTRCSTASSNITALSRLRSRGNWD